MVGRQVEVDVRLPDGSLAVDGDLARAIVSVQCLAALVSIGVVVSFGPVHARLGSSLVLLFH